MIWSSREPGYRDVVVDGDDIPIITIISMFLFCQTLSKGKEANLYAVTTAITTIARRRRKKRPRFWEVPIDLYRR